MFMRQECRMMPDRRLMSGYKNHVHAVEVFPEIERVANLGNNNKSKVTYNTFQGFPVKHKRKGLPI